MGLKKLTEKSGHMPDSARLVEQLTQCFCRLAKVNSDIREQRARGDLSGNGALLSEQQDLLQRIQDLRNKALPEALLREERMEREMLPAQIEELQGQITTMRAHLLDELRSKAEHFFEQLILVGAKRGNEGAAIVLPPGELRDCLTQALSASEKSQLRSFERSLDSKRIALNAGPGTGTHGKAGSMTVNAMSRASEQHGFDFEIDFAGPLYRNET